MKNTLLYTFRTFPNILELESLELPVIVLGKLKEDLEKVKDYITENKVRKVVGIAKAKNFSQIETIAINDFNGNKLNLDGPDFYRLNMHLNYTFKTSKDPGNTFCNWTMYQLMEWKKENNLNFELSFIHILPSEIPNLLKL